MDYLGIKDFEYSENEYCRYGNTYSVKDIIELSLNHNSFDMPISGIDISGMPWGNQSIKSYCYHVKRMNNADLKYPIILDDTGYICDGWHRLAMAIILGNKSIKAIRLTVMPEPTTTNSEQK